MLAHSSKISVVDNEGNAEGFEATVSGNQLTVNPNEDLKEGTLYTVTVAAGAVTDKVGNSLKDSLNIEFKTKQLDKPNNNTSQTSSSKNSNSSSLDPVSASTVDKAISASTSQDVKVEISPKEPMVEKGVFEVLAKNPTKNLVLTGDNYSWTFTGADIASNIILPNNTTLPKDIDTTISTISPNVEEINKVTFEKPVMNVYFSIMEHYQVKQK